METGAAIVVIDVDPRNGGDKILRALQNQHGMLPATVTANTGGGGQHYFFKHPGAKLNTKLGVGIDVKREGGYVVASPSNHASGGGSWSRARRGRRAPLGMCEIRERGALRRRHPFALGIVAFQIVGDDVAVRDVAAEQHVDGNGAVCSAPALLGDLRQRARIVKAASEHFRDGLRMASP